ncbi:uncharacterized protein LOC119141544 [Falco rusticolus]|uniref:uncharacterized protein LOC119141544 n=1 Tax=Falco rusticolus TaxID=120794 RepID=UPI001886A8E5|nr:uncharacterized protein LOC119141544 [Falco rusticolus]
MPARPPAPASVGAEAEVPVLQRGVKQRERRCGRRVTSREAPAGPAWSWADAPRERAGRAAQVNGDTGREGSTGFSDDREGHTFCIFIWPDNLECKLYGTVPGSPLLQRNGQFCCIAPHDDIINVLLMSWSFTLFQCSLDQSMADAMQKNLILMEPRSDFKRWKQPSILKKLRWLQPLVIGKIWREKFSISNIEFVEVRRRNI